ncbi:NAD-dependent epimerase/dehydratase family protein [Mycobacterium sp.]|uniref:NAD-dependent epimerase/dehydratase family protein n=1 Tax=Mycobacterium sp. TaxID=1785 RepID=UPI002CDFC843|nr:NAD-dependent epimerase/dehydratase family protein [Mycobacterium sp.]HTQ19837.1 NAD-dependent epimerase/dehydratase family protein [Mycobacterium sp.]
MSDRGIIAITGANGYVGMSLYAAFGAAGYRVIALQRSAPSGATDYVPYSLEDGPAAPLPSDVAAVVHCAYDLRARDHAEIERINIGGTAKLLQAVGNVPFVLISSQSAYAGTQQIYGRVKLACEDLVTARGGTSLRLGLVYGGADGGMIGALSRVAALPIVPLPSPDSHQYVVHADDMARCVVAATRQPPPHHVVGVANPRRVSFSEIIRTLRAARTAKPHRTVPVPSALVYRALRAAEGIGVRAGFRADSLLGLMHPAPDVPNVDHWAECGIALRDFADDARHSLAG